MPDEKRALSGAHDDARDEAATELSGARVRRVRRQPIDDFDRAGRQIADVLRAADRVAETTRQQTEEWVSERHAVVDRELASRHDQATAAESRAKRVLAEAEERLADAETTAGEAVELQEQAAARVRQIEAERRERAESDRREAERVLAKARAAAAGIVAAAETEATDLLRSVFDEQQQRLDHLRAEEERTAQRMESLLGAMPAGERLQIDTTEESGLGPTIDLRPEDPTDPAPAEPAADLTDEADPRPTVAVGEGVAVSSGGTDADPESTLRLVDGLEEAAVADIVQSAVHRATGRSGSDGGDVPASDEPSESG